MAARTAPLDTSSSPPTAPPAPPPGPAFDLAFAPQPVVVQPAPAPVDSTGAQTDAGRKPRGSRAAGRGVPMAPVLAAAGNATAMVTTGAYQAAGVPGVAAAGAVVVAGAAAAVLRRRSTVRRSNLNRRQQRLTQQHGAGGGRRSPTSNWTMPSSTSGRGGGRGAGGGPRPGAGPGLGAAPRKGAGAGIGAGAGASGLGGRRPGGVTADWGAKSPSGRGSGAGAGGGAGRSRGHGGANTGSHGLKAWAGRTARDAAKRAAAEGSLPRRAAAKTAKSLALRPDTAVGRTARRALKHLRGVGADGAVAAGAGLWAALRSRSGRAALARLKDVWARRRKKRAGDAAAAAEKAVDLKKTTGPEGIAATVRRPTAPTTARSTATAGGTPVSGHHFTAPAMEMARIASTYEPTGMLQVGEDFAGLKEALELIAEAMKVTVENADAKQPLDPRIIDIMRQIHGMQIKAAELANELVPAFESLHHVDLDRLRNPRKGAAGERMWDVSTNLGYSA